MTLEAYVDTLPGYARDLKLNLSSVLRQTELTSQQLWGTAVASAVASRNRELLRALEQEAQRHLSPEALKATKTAAALMGMTNIYYRFQHLAANPKYATIPSHLRMQGKKNHGVSQLDFELWCIAVSAINGCSLCVAAHEEILLGRGVTEEQILAAVRIASVVHGIASVMDVENVQTYAGV